jgi:hypothetical protein
MEEDFYFITRLSWREDPFTHFLSLSHGVVGDTQLEYVQIYVDMEVHSSSEFLVHDAQLWISSFGREDVRCMCLIL